MIKLKQFCVGIVFVTHLSLSAIPNLVLLGPPGCGKGTFASILKQHFGYYQISIGDILRSHVRENTGIGKLKVAAKQEGKYLDDTIVFRIIDEQISSCLQNKTLFILDNFPRNVKAFNFVIDLFRRYNLSTKNVKFIRFHTSDRTSFERILNRRVCPNVKCAYSYNLVTKRPKVDGICDRCKSKLIRRPSDTPENTKRRLRLYRENVEPLADKAKLCGFQVIEVNADIPIQQCAERYQALIRAKL
jgi:adenylate kinase